MKLPRGRITTPKLARHMIEAVVQTWLSQTSLMLRGTDQCMREMSGLQTERRTSLRTCRTGSEQRRRLDAGKRLMRDRNHAVRRNV